MNNRNLLIFELNNLYQILLELSEYLKLNVIKISKNEIIDSKIKNLTSYLIITEEDLKIKNSIDAQFRHIFYIVLAGSKSNNRINSIAFNKNLESIGNKSFSNNKLEKITLPANLVSIGNEAFANNLLASADLTASIENVGTKAFENNLIASVKFSTKMEIIQINKTNPRMAHL